MAPSKLSESDKRDILDLYRQVGETTSTLASRYGVSNTTISRLLKNSLSEDEYEALIQQKRATRSTLADETEEDSLASEVEQLEIGDFANESEDEDPLIESVQVEAEPESDVVEIDRPKRRSRKRASVVNDTDDVPEPPTAITDLDVTAAIGEEISPVAGESYGADAAVFEEILGEDLLDQDAELLDLDEDEDEEDDLDDDDLDDEIGFADEVDGAPLAAAMQIRADTFIKVLPLAEAFIPKTCYLVVDRTAELVARPLREFADLGQIPAEEVQEKTLPIFDNHRVAKRFSNRAQRVIKVPDSRVLQKASSHLQAKGITRLLIDGQVYALN
jgi:transposase-like protein